MPVSEFYYFKRPTLESLKEGKPWKVAVASSLLAMTLWLIPMCLRPQPSLRSPRPAVVSSPSLLKYATKAANNDGWAEDMYGTAYYWQSNTSVLFFRAADGVGTLWRRNVQTNTETSTGITFQDDDTDPILSPDGRWLLCFGQAAIVVNELGGSRSEMWYNHGNVISWFNDSRHWIDVVKTRALIHSLDAPTRTESVRLPRTSLLLRKDIADGGFYNIRCLSKSLFVAHTDLMPHPYGLETLYGLPQVNLFAGRLDADARHTRHYTFRAPAGYRIFDVMFSPDGTQVAWLLQSSKTGRVSLRVSRLNLSDMHELGTLEDKWAAENLSHLAARYSLRWLPNGKRLSFFYQNTLWTVPIIAGSSTYALDSTARVLSQTMPDKHR